MDNRFTYNPTNVSITRSRFQRNSTHKTTFNAGELVPIYLDEVLPGDTVSLDTAHVCRMATPIYPVMDNAYLDVYYFFVPMRLVWEHTKQFFGENTDGPWVPSTTYSIPQMNVVFSGTNSVLDHFGLPVYQDMSNTLSVKYSVSVLPLRAYALIWNEWFRDQNVSTPIPIPLGDSSITIYDTTRSWDSYADVPATHFFINNNACLPVGKFHDLFTSALREPQKGPDVLLPLTGALPINAGDQVYEFDNPLALGLSSDLSPANSNFTNLYARFNALPNLGDRSLFSIVSDTSGMSTAPTVNAEVVKSNLYADLSDAAQLTINNLRYALALQGLYELDARGGTRYREIIKSHFGVTSPDARMQIPEYLHGRRIPISMQQVLQTSSSNDTSPQGNTAAYSLTQDRSNSFTYSATEHGFIIGLCCVRTSQSYQQRIERLWSRKDRFDFYWPVFANIGEQPIYNKELFFNPLSTDQNDRVFGFQEAWADYRYKPSMITGKFRSHVSGSLDVWHYAEAYGSTPTLSEAFIYQNSFVVQRTLAVTNEPQFIADFAFNSTWVRPMPMYSIPALLGRM